MQIRTIAVTVSAKCDLVFGFLADIENLPKWAGDFCERIELRRNGWLAYTSLGDAMLAAEADDHTGVIDLRIEPAANRPGWFLLRVVPVSPMSTLVSFTFIQPPVLSDKLYEQQYVSWRRAMEGLLPRVGGGELHSSVEVSHFGVLGLN